MLRRKCQASRLFGAISASIGGCTQPEEGGLGSVLGETPAQCAAPAGATGLKEPSATPRVDSVRCGAIPPSLCRLRRRQNGSQDIPGPDASC
jgi:hypothetical protein